MRVMARVDEGMGRLVEVVIRADPVLVGNFGEQLHVLQIRAADIDVEEDQVPILLLLLHEIAEVGLDREKGLRQTFSGRDAVDRQIDCGDPCAAYLVDELFVQQISVGGQVHEKALLRSVPDDLQDKLLLQQGLSAHKRYDATTDGFKPVYRAERGIQAHGVSLVIVLMAVVAVDVAFPFRKKIAEDRAEFRRVDSRVKVGYYPRPNGPGAVFESVFKTLHHGPPPEESGSVRTARGRCGSRTVLLATR